METTNEIYNVSIHKLITPKCVLTWVRGLISTYLANTGKDWVDTFAQFNSGTYNDQWMVFDTKLFTPGKALPADSLWITEQIPGYLHSADVTDVLNAQGYWASYNIPYFDDIWEASGMPPGTNATSHNNCARANIFRRNQTAVHTLGELQELMRYNDYLHDPLSLGMPTFAIAGRFDLIPVVGETLGAIDVKITTSELMRKGGCWLYCGPPNEQVPSFSWRRWSSVSHVGVPETDNFKWVLV
eukprot:TRINITY_DN6117_c0_g1_i5.p1 TRINITY_DN6117_c0_g1~~TRINITY_DN6117_c0_g1_i5.p1  ORF type:complete len:242 (+),score=32.84 TRINITY_DN6117_c0_g1_i5:985-1710(+)